MSSKVLGVTPTSIRSGPIAAAAPSCRSDARSALDSLREQSDGTVSELQVALRAAARREELLRGTVSSQLQALRDKDDVVAALRARLAIAAAAAKASSSSARDGGGSDGGKLSLSLGTSAQQLSEENVALSSVNRALGARAKELEAQVTNGVGREEVRSNVQ